MNAFSLLTSHFLVMLFVAEHPKATIRQIAHEVDITERRVADIISDLVKDGYLISSRIGRRNQYELIGTTRMSHSLVSDLPVGLLIDAITTKRCTTRTEAPTEDPALV